MNYLIISNSYHILNDEINKIFKNLDDVEIINYQDTTLEEIVNIASYFSLFSDEKKIIVKNCDFFSSKNSVKTDILEKYLSNPNSLTTIIFTYTDKVDERKKIVKHFIDNKTFTYIKPLSYKDISAKLIDIAKKNKYKLSLSDANYITMSSLNNLDIAINELEKMFLYYNEPCEIKKEDLDIVISRSIDDNNFKFIDAVIQRNIKEAMKLINNFKLFKIEPIILVSLLIKEYRNILIAKTQYQKGYSNAKIKSALGLSQDWQVDKLINNTYSYSVKELEDKLLDLCDLDYKIKVSNIDKYLGLEMFILKG